MLMNFQLIWKFITSRYGLEPRTADWSIIYISRVVNLSQSLKADDDLSLYVHSPCQ